MSRTKFASEWSCNMLVVKVSLAIFNFNKITAGFVTTKDRFQGHNINEAGLSNDSGFQFDSLFLN